MLEQLLKYQEIDGKLYELEQLVAKSEERQKVASAKRFLDSVGEKVASLDEKARKLFDTYETYRQKYTTLLSAEKEYETAINEAEDGGEIEYIRKKANALLNDMNELENIVVGLKKLISDVIESYDKLKTQTRTAQKQYSDYFPKYKELRDSHKIESDKIAAELQKMEKDIDSALLERYKMRRKSGYPVLVPMREDGINACPKCGMEFAMVARNNMASKGYIECENCRIIVYKK